MKVSVVEVCKLAFVQEGCKFALVVLDTGALPEVRAHSWVWVAVAYKLAWLAVLACMLALLVVVVGRPASWVEAGTVAVVAHTLVLGLVVVGKCELEDVRHR